MRSRPIHHFKSYEIRGLATPVQRVQVASRTVDYWAPTGSKHLIVTHDGQNIFDRRTATRGFTWRLAQQAIEVFRKAELPPPTIIAVFHSTSEREPHGRALDLTPEAFFRAGLPVLTEVPSDISLQHLRGDQYLDEIFDVVIPAISESLDQEFGFENRALLGSSMGGLSTLYEAGRNPKRYGAALAFSPHWVLGGEPLVRSTVELLEPASGQKVWMSRGTRKLDRDYEPYQDLADDLMSKQGWSRKNFSSRINRGAGHNERAWARQVADALEFWLAD